MIRQLLLVGFLGGSAVLFGVAATGAPYSARAVLLYALCGAVAALAVCAAVALGVEVGRKA